MKFFKPTVLSPKQIEYRKRIRAQGRKHYIIHTGVLHWGMSVFVLTTLWSWYQDYRWHVPPRGYMWFSVIFGLILCSVAGYFWGAYMWRRIFEDQSTGIPESAKNPEKGFDFRSVPRARITAPAIHVLLFVLVSLSMLVSDKPILNGPAKVPFGILFFGDLPISAFAFSVMFTSEKSGWTAWGLWGIAGTVWWYFLGLSIEAWIRRFSRAKN